MSEKLRLCTDFGELRAGSMIVAKCRWCNGRHRGVLVRFLPVDEDFVLTTKGRLPSTDRWEMLPALQHNRPRTTIGRATVAERLVYIVETGNDATREQAEGKRDSMPRKESVR